MPMCVQVCPRCCLRLVNSRSAYDVPAPSRQVLWAAISQCLTPAGNAPSKQPQTALAASAAVQSQLAGPIAVTGLHLVQQRQERNELPAQPHLDAAKGSPSDDAANHVAVNNENVTALPADSSPHSQEGGSGNQLPAHQASISQQHTTAHDPEKPSASQPSDPPNAAESTSTDKPLQDDGASEVQPCSICLGVMQSVEGQVGAAASNTLLKKFSKDDNSAGTWTPLQQCTVESVAEAFRSVSEFSQLLSQAEISKHVNMTGTWTLFPGRFMIDVAKAPARL